MNEHKADDSNTIASPDDSTIPEWPTWSEHSVDADRDEIRLNFLCMCLGTLTSLTLVMNQESPGEMPGRVTWIGIDELIGAEKLSGQYGHLPLFHHTTIAIRDGQSLQQAANRIKSAVPLLLSAREAAFESALAIPIERDDTFLKHNPPSETHFDALAWPAWTVEGHVGAYQYQTVYDGTVCSLRVSSQVATPSSSGLLDVPGEVTALLTYSDENGVEGDSATERTVEYVYKNRYLASELQFITTLILDDLPNILQVYRAASREILNQVEPGIGSEDQ